MKAPLIPSSAIEKAILVAAFIPLAFVVYPHAAYAANPAQNPGENALVFEVNSKQKTNSQLSTVTPVNPTLSNPCYPAPADTCNPDASPAQQKVVQAAAVNVAAGYTGKLYSKEEVEQMINHYAALYGVDPQTPLCIAFRESGYNQFSKNKRSSASGVYQYLTSTWKATDEGKAGHSVFDAEANVKAAVKYMAIHKSTKPWTVRSKCPALAFTK